MDATSALDILREINKKIWNDPIKPFLISLHGMFTDVGTGKLFEADALPIEVVPQLIAGGAVRKVKVGHYTILTQNPNKPTSRWAEKARAGAKILWLLDDSLNSNSFIYMLLVDEDGENLYQFNEGTRQWTKLSS